MKGDKIMKKTVGRNKSRFVTIVSLAIALSLTFTAFAGCNAAGTNMAPSIDFSEDGVSNEDKFNNEEYEEIIENKFISVKENPLSTFSADVDTAAYSNLRRMINAGYSIEAIPKNAIRTEEILNYFKYDYALPENNEPFGVSASISACPWNPENLLAIFGFRTEEISYEDNNKPSNFVFLIDVSGSMNSQDKLPLLKEAFSGLTDRLTENDRVSIVTYSGKEKIVLKGCPGDQKDKILKAINNLEAGGSTNGQSGLEKAYSLASDYFIEGGNNRIIMASDGDLNVGISSPEELKKFVEEKRQSGIYLSVLGFGSGNYKDNNMEALADHGNGNYFYIDSVEEGRKVLGDDLNATVNTVANDVKFQIDFNSAFVDSYRLIGYENRVMDANDFNDDKKDAGEVGSGHMLTVAYELVPTDAENDDNGTNEWLTVSVRYKVPGTNDSKLLEYPITDSSLTNETSDDWKFAATLIEFCMMLRESRYLSEDRTMEDLLAALYEMDLKNDIYKTEFITLVEKLIKTAPRSDATSRYDL
jgi:Ca-activated chloride channel family protein